MDVTNPGLVNVADDVVGNPDPNGGTAQREPREMDELVSAADEGYPPAENTPPADVFPTPDETLVTGVVPLYPSNSTPQPAAAEVNVDDQSIGQGSMVPVDPLDPTAGYYFRSPDEFVVVGPTESFQTNRTETDRVLATVAAVLDANNLPALAGPNTTRYYLRVTIPPPLTSYPVSLLGRQIVFADDTLTVADQGAARVITGYGGNFVVVDRDDPTPNNGNVAVLVTPQIGDTFEIYVGRQGSEDVNSTGSTPIDVLVLPPPPPFVPNPAQALRGGGTTNTSTGAQPGDPVISSGTPAPASITVEIADQCAVVGLPANVYI